MKSKVTLKEIVGTKIIFAVLVTCYYWMWARTDWQDYYTTIQYIIFGFTVLFFAIQADRIRKYKKEERDELAVQNLKRCDSICLKIFLSIMVIAAYLGGILGHTEAINTAQMGWIIMITVVVLSIIRTILFAVMDSKGI